ncbi:MAG: glycerol-3-phosphate acyltransferase, partial [Gammaproteobacteria bacterium]
LAATALAAFLGHLYPVFFGFIGGKGVATAFGVVVGLDWRVGLLSIGAWLVMALLFRYSSLAALTAMLLVPAGLWWLQGDTVSVALMTLMVVILYWRHRSNIRNLLSGAEEKISFGAKRSP